MPRHSAVRSSSCPQVPFSGCSFLRLCRSAMCSQPFRRIAKKISSAAMRQLRVSAMMQARHSIARAVETGNHRFQPLRGVDDTRIPLRVPKSDLGSMRRIEEVSHVRGCGALLLPRSCS